MDIINILTTVKGKVLDATNFDILKHAYELQDENLFQLKTNNEAIKESNALLKEKIQELRDENDSLKKSIDSFATSDAPERNKQGLSKVAKEILRLYRKSDATMLYTVFMKISLKKEFSNIQVEAGIVELARNNIIRFQSSHATHGYLYILTDTGKITVAGNSFDKE